MSITFERSKEIYKQIAKANGFIYRPWLFLKSDSEVSTEVNIFSAHVHQGTLDLFNEDELAFLFGHELAHLQFKHLFNILKNHEKEFDADKVGAQYASKAGFNMSIGKGMLKKVVYPSSITHPAAIDRYNELTKQGW